MMFIKRGFRINFKIPKTIQLRFNHGWIQPEGYDTGIKIYNERLKTKVPLIFPNKNRVTWYMCGPTVYDSTHIGHASSYVRLDIIRRILKEHFGITPIVAQGITDISVEIYEKGLEQETSWHKIAKRYEREFFEEMKKLNVLEPSFVLRVQDHLNVINNFISKLVEKDVAYEGNDGSMYFSIAKDPNYGRFKNVQEETDKEKGGKRNYLDFALWKNTSLKCLDSPFGNGLPGWHIECSAMASKVFGNSVDIHSGGSDLIFPHHENEEAQSTCYHGCQQWVNYWLHTGLLNVSDVKMSKSLGNFITVRQFFMRNTSDHFRMLCLMTQYRKGLNYSDDTVQQAVTLCEKIDLFLEASENYLSGFSTTGNVKEAELLKELEQTKKTVKDYLGDDFSTSNALNSVIKLINKTMTMLGSTGESETRSFTAVAMVNLYVREFFNSLGFTVGERVRPFQRETVLTPVQMMVDWVVKYRRDVRKIVLRMPNSDFKHQFLITCDEFRKKLENIGVFVRDAGPNWALWEFQDEQKKCGSVVKSILDLLVWFTIQIHTLSTFITEEEMMDEITSMIRTMQLRFYSLGINIGKISDGRTFWSYIFENYGDLEQELTDRVVSYFNDIRLASEPITDEDVKKNMVSLCNSAESELKSLVHKTERPDIEQSRSYKSWRSEANSHQVFRKNEGFIFG
ncbi:UNVERIFIED_CONTAM: hypothetical protein PYX00_003787 [Menopon gallinae]|uniref:cysteine--tRNA ligase n=1 Tax=Menopon gallinae TaxID=328185 RepID=A0AAW2I309_9NEOP